MSRTESLLSRFQRSDAKAAPKRTVSDGSSSQNASQVGMVAVPVKPSPEMIAAGIMAGTVSARLAFEIYQAMIAATEPGVAEGDDQT